MLSFNADVVEGITEVKLEILHYAGVAKEHIYSVITELAIEDNFEDFLRLRVSQTEDHENHPNTDEFRPHYD